MRDKWKKMEEGEWGGETGRRPNSNGSTSGEERGGRDYKAGLKSDLARQAHWDKPGMTEMPIAPKDMSPTGRPVHPKAFG